MTKAVEAQVTGIGHAGDGLVCQNTRTVYVPWTVPGDTIRFVADQDCRGTLEAVVVPSRHRIAPVCQHFADCGGCVAQHFDAATYLNWRREQIVGALRRRGFEAPPVAEPVMIDAGTRRRATLAWRRTKGCVLLGFRARGTHRIVDMSMCPALHPSIVAMLDGFRKLASRLEVAGRLDVTVCDNGLDVTLEQRHEPDLEVRQAIGRFASDTGVARVSWRAGQGGAPDLIIQHQPPIVTMAGVALKFPAATFLQPSVDGEIGLQNAVTDMVGDAKRIADLFCGCGTLSLAMARRGAVDAFDSDRYAIDALRAAAGVGGKLHALGAASRDLFRRPLALDELAAYDAVVFDPPRAGAAAQATALAQSDVPTVVAVSCHPATFARDARLLVDGGYALRRVVPIDQFVWSQHLEVVALFER
jgi:23S rRNA (uracil1939-C5)-methyltransferase